MAGDLGMSAGEVHRWAREILAFWLEEIQPDRRFARDPVLDEEIRSRFSAARDSAMRSGGLDWKRDPETTLAAIILLDQFSRNMFRDQAEAFTADPIARMLARHAIDRDWDRRMTSEQRQFLYMPFMHSEDSVDQALSVSLFTALGDEEALDYARRHADRIRTFGRFPHRNAALGRLDTTAELVLLSQPDEAF